MTTLEAIIGPTLSCSALRLLQEYGTVFLCNVAIAIFAIQALKYCLRPEEQPAQHGHNNVKSQTARGGKKCEIDFPWNHIEVVHDEVGKR